MKTALLVLVAALAAGCAGSLPRSSITAAERSHQVVIKHSDPEAFQHVELSLAEAYNDLPRVLKLRQPESGTLLLKPLVSYGVLGYGRHAEYTLKVVVGESEVRLDFELGGDSEHGGYPPASEVTKIKDRFEAIGVRLAAAVKGEI